MKKKVIAMLIMVGLMTEALMTGCGNSDTGKSTDTPAKEKTESSADSAKKEEKSIRGILRRANAEEADMEEFMNKSGSSQQKKVVFYDNLNTLIMALEKGDIDKASNLPECTARYIVARNDKLKVTLPKPDKVKTANWNYSMTVREENTDLLKKLNAEIKAMKADGTLEKLAKDDIEAYISTTDEPKTVDLPVIEGAETITVAVTGDLPPIDLVTADGKPAGFNVALLAELSRRMNVNVKILSVNTAARTMALSSGKADVVFWAITGDDDVASGNTDIPDKVAITDSYYTSKTVNLDLK